VGGGAQHGHAPGGGGSGIGNKHTMGVNVCVCVSCISHLVEKVVCGCACIDIDKVGAVASSFRHSHQLMECVEPCQ
jgi:hypothetical protein